MTWAGFVGRREDLMEAEEGIILERDMGPMTFIREGGIVQLTRRLDKPRSIYHVMDKDIKFKRGTAEVRNILSYVAAENLDEVLSMLMEKFEYL